MNLSSLLKISLVAAFCFLIAETSHAQDKKFLMRLDSSWINKFQEYGSLKSIVKAGTDKSSIGFIELQYAGSENKPPIDANLGISVRGNEAAIVLDNNLIAQIKGQPLRIKVDDNARGFDELLLIYDAPSPLSDLPVITDSSGEPMDVVYIRLKDTDEMAGGIEGLTSIELDTKFGKVTIPMTEIAGIRLHTDDDDSAVVVLNNGDAITGIPTLKNLSLITDWGQADIETEFVESLTTSSSARFTEQQSDLGPRWNLNTGISVAPGVPPLR